MVNANGDLDDFLIFDITNACNSGTVLKTVQVSVFLSRNENQIQHDQAEQHHRQSHDGQGQKDHIEEDQVKDQSQTQNDLEQQRCQEGQGQQDQIEQQLEDQSQGQQQKSKRAKHLVSLKIRKMFLLLSYSFWSKVFFINSLSNENGSDYNKWALLQTLLCFPVNVALVLCSTFCPVVFTVYVFVIKYIMVFFGNIFYECLSCKKNRVEIKEKKWIRFVLKSVSHCLTLIYFFHTYKCSFNIFFYGLSYVIQFFIFTLFLAVPHIPIQSYIHIIFFTSVAIYIFRFVYQFTNLYKSLLETILDIEQQNSIPIKHFDKIVAKHFPLYNELFYMFVKIMLSSLFFAIIYDTMQKVGYIRFGAQPDLTTVISLIF